MSRVQVGRACVTRIVEFQFELGTTVFRHDSAVGMARQRRPAGAGLLRPGHRQMAHRGADLGRRGRRADRRRGHRRRQRSSAPAHAAARSPEHGFLHAWDSAGIDRGAVDVVINTHIHSDHVGWNTMLDRGNWVPTFPNARYLAPAADYRHFAPDGPAARQSPRTEAEAAQQHGDQLVFADSVAPVDEAGQLVQWADDYQISPSLRLRPAPGHTPGSSVLWLDAGEPAVFVGDITHSPLQVRRPEDPCAFDVDAARRPPPAAGYSPRPRYAGAAVIPAHYPGHGGATIRAVADRFEIDEWLEIESRMSYRVIQWSTGNIGSRALGILLDRNDFDVVGVHAFGSDKVGRDASVLANPASAGPEIGVAATDDVDALIELAPDCVNYMPRAIDYDLVTRMLRSGINVVTTGDFVTGTHHPAELPALRGGGAPGRRDVPGHRIRAGFHQRGRRLPHRRVPKSAQRQARRDIGLHHLSRAGRMEGARIRQAAPRAGDAPRPGDATIRPRLLRDARHDRHDAGCRTRLQGRIRRALRC